MNKYTTEFIKKFCLRFDPDTKESCWEWTAGKDSNGYGRIRHDGPDVLAHRVSYELFVGFIPDGLHVRHRCDNPGCVNPYHLEVGTVADNVRDRDERGRQAKGSGHGMSRLSEPEVSLIKEFLIRHPPVRGKHGGPCGFLSRWFGVARPTVSSIHTQKNWTHVTVE